METPASGDGGERIDRAAVAEIAVRGAAWSLLARWGGRVLSIVAFAVLARLVAPDAFGVLAVATSVVELLRLVGNQGLAQALIRDPDIDAEALDTVFWMNVAGAAVVAAIVALAAPILEEAYDADGLASVMRVVALHPALSALGAVPLAMLSKELQFRRLGVINLTAAIVATGVAVAVAAAGGGVWALVAQLLVQTGLTSAIALIVSRYRPHLRFNGPRARQLARFGWTAALADLSTALVQQGDNLVIGAVLGKTLLGYYAIAYRLMVAVLDLFAGVLSTLSLPVFSRLWRDTSATVAALLRATKLVFLTGSFAFGSLFVLAPLVIPAAFGDAWQPSIWIFQILCFAGILLSLTYFDRGVLFAAGRPGLDLVLTAVFAVGTVVAAVIGAQFGLVAATVAVTVRMYVTWPLRLVMLRRVLPIDIRLYLRQLVPASLAVAALLGTAWITRLLLPDESWTAVVGALVGASAFVAVVWRFDRAFVARELRTLRTASRPR